MSDLKILRILLTGLPEVIRSVFIKKAGVEFGLAVKTAFIERATKTIYLNKEALIPGMI